MRKILCFIAAAIALTACHRSYTNPVLYADISDPDAIAVDGEYWMTASSFNCCPGLLIYHSTDLVHWNIVNAALPDGLAYQGPCERPRHGDGVFAPSIRYHDGQWWIFWGDPDLGIYQVHTDNPLGEWSKPHCVIRARGMIDPCPLWDDDGRVWLVHAWAKSRCGFNGILSVCELNSDCTECIGEQHTVFDGNSTGNRTVEGSKFYKRNGKYIVMAPAGGVKTGWQLVMQSDSPLGPYEWKVAMHQGDTDVFGPHQGAWVSDSDGQDWFLHFEDRYAFGRILHLQPMEWTADGFCIIGRDRDSDGIGEPVLRHRAPAVSGREVLPQDDRYLFQYQDFAGESRAEPARLWDDPTLSLRKIEGPKMVFEADFEGRDGGIVVIGDDYSTIELRHLADSVQLRRRSCFGAMKGGTESFHDIAVLPAGARCSLRVVIEEVRNFPEQRFGRHDTYVALCRFEYDSGSGFRRLGEPFAAKAGRWIGAKVGEFPL